MSLLYGMIQSVNPLIRQGPMTAGGMSIFIKGKLSNPSLIIAKPLN